MEQNPTEIKTTRNALKWLWKTKKRLSRKFYAMSPTELEAYLKNIPYPPGVKVTRAEDMYPPISH
jgi:hypothetical protein